MSYENPSTGLIVHPSEGGNIDRYNLSPKAKEIFESKHKTTEALIEGLLDDLCTWYNTQKTTTDHNPHQLAAELQRRFVSIHPYDDGNGTASRVLMNWSLENAGEDPSILDEPNNDILINPNEWTDEVLKGQARYEEIDKRRKQLEAIGYLNASEMMDLSKDKTFYDQIYKHIKHPPLPSKPGESMDHKQYEAFLLDFDKQRKAFNQEYGAIRKNDLNGKEINFRQGGLIPQSLIDLACLQPKDYQEYNQYIRSNYLNLDNVVFRGGQSSDPISEQDTIHMFEDSIGINTGYSALIEANVSPTSKDNVPSSAISHAMESYNRYMVNTYREKYDQKIMGQDAWGPRFIKIINAHIGNEGLTNFSPFVSTSLGKHISLDSYADPTGFFGKIVKGKGGILFETSAALKNGCILSFPEFLLSKAKKSDIPGLPNLNLGLATEEEVLIPGGILPSAINKITVFDKVKVNKDDKDELERRTAITAERSGNNIHISSYRPTRSGEEYSREPREQKTYKLNKTTGKYLLVETKRYDPETQQLVPISLPDSLAA